jgi:hypothetical protein
MNYYPIIRAVIRGAVAHGSDGVKTFIAFAGSGVHAGSSRNSPQKIQQFVWNFLIFSTPTVPVAHEFVGNSDANGDDLPPGQQPHYAIFVSLLQNDDGIGGS